MFKFIITLLIAISSNNGQATPEIREIIEQPIEQVITETEQEQFSDTYSLRIKDNNFKENIYGKDFERARILGTDFDIEAVNDRTGEVVATLQNDPIMFSMRTFSLNTQLAFGQQNELVMPINEIRLKCVQSPCTYTGYIIEFDSEMINKQERPQIQIFEYYSDRGFDTGILRSYLRLFIN